MKILFSLIIISLFFVVGCNQPDKTTETEEKNSETKEHEIELMEPEINDVEVVARVNGKPVTRFDLARNRSIDQAIMDEILFQEGIKQGYGKVHERRVHAYLKTLVVNDMKDKIISKQGPGKEITEEDIREYYDKNFHLYSTPYIKEIQVNDKTIAQEILQKAKNGEKLENIARDYSDSNAIVTVNDLGNNSNIAALFQRPLQIGDVYHRVIQRSENSYSVYKIVDVKVQSYEIVKGSIKSKVEGRNTDQAIREYVDELVEKNNITIER